MILRNVVMGIERQALRPDSPTAAKARLPGRPEAPALEVVQRLQSPVPVEAPLSIERIRAWLTTQSAETRVDCARLLAAEIEAVSQAAREQGLELGRAQGIREVAERAQSGLGALAKVATAAEEAFALESAQLADACTEIVAEAFVKLAGRRLGTRKAAVSVVLQVLKRIKDGRELTIKVSAADLPMLQSQESDIARVLGTRRWTLMADARVSLGGCLVESVLGTLDGRLEVQLRELFETLRAARVSRLEVE